jgi:hypothetical protein
LTTFNVFPALVYVDEIVEVKSRMNLKAVIILGLVVFAALIGTAFAATESGATITETRRSGIRNRVRDCLGYFEDHWDEMGEHWNSNSFSGYGCR